MKGGTTRRNGLIECGVPLPDVAAVVYRDAIVLDPRVEIEAAGSIGSAHPNAELALQPSPPEKPP